MDSPLLPAFYERGRRRGERDSASGSESESDESGKASESEDEDDGDGSKKVRFVEWSGVLEVELIDFDERMRVQSRTGLLGWRFCSC